MCMHVYSKVNFPLELGQMYYVFIEDVLCTTFWVRDSSLEMTADTITMSHHIY